MSEPKNRRRGPQQSTRERFVLFDEIHRAHPNWTARQVADEAQHRHPDWWHHGITGDDVRRTYKAMGALFPYNTLAQAVAAVRRGASVRGAARQCGVSESTLRRAMKEAA